MTKRRIHAEPRRRFTPRECEIVRSRYPHEATEPIARELRCSKLSLYQLAARLGVKKTPARIREALAECGREITRHPKSIAARFQKGSVPANKGTRRPGWFAGRMRETQLKKGERQGKAAQNFCEIGTVRWVSVSGTNPAKYLYVKIGHATHPPYGYPSKEAWKLLHHKVWEDAGNPPVNTRTHALMFKDGDRSNCTIENLELITRAENARRNSIHRLPAPLKEAIVARGALVRAIRRRERGGRNQRSA